VGKDDGGRTVLLAKSLRESKECQRWRQSASKKNNVQETARLYSAVTNFLHMEKISRIKLAYSPANFYFPLIEQIKKANMEGSRERLLIKAEWSGAVLKGKNRVAA